MNVPAPGERLRGGTLALVAVALALGTFMQVLDGTIANVSLTTIAGNLGASADNSTWVITAFAVANGITVPLTGWLMRRFGVVRTYVAAVSLFSLASFLCGIAWNLPSLIVFRLLQGAVSGPMIPGSQALLLVVFPPEKRSLALGVWSMTTLIGPVMGPILGGWISDNFHWGWIFLINVPVGLASGFVVWRFLRQNDTPWPGLRVDVIGIAMLAIWAGSLQVVLDLGKDADWFSSTLIVWLSIVSAVTFIAWLIWEATDKDPAVDISLFRGRNFSIGVVAQSLGYAIFFSNNLLLPLWLQREMGYTATWAGLVSAPSGVAAIVLTPLVTRYSHKFDMRLLASLAFLFFGLSYLMRSHFTAQVDVWHLTLPLMVQGVAMSTFFMGMLTITLDGVPQHRLPAATGISNFVRITSGSFAASVITTMWDRREALHQSRLVEAMSTMSNGLGSAATHLEGLGLSPTAAAATMNGAVVQQAYLLAATDLFWLSSLGCFAMMALLWLAHRPAPPSGPVAAD